MTQPARIFWDVDTQVDFLSPGEKLYVPGSETIVPALQRLTRWAADNMILVVASVDAHHENDPEFQHWPPHCLVGTEGQQKIRETTLPRQLVLPNHPVTLPADFSGWQQLVVEKQQLDVFTNPNAAPLVERLGRPDIVLYGVVTELCVALAAKNLLRQGCRVTLVEDAIASLEPARARAYVDELIQHGASVASTGEIVAAAQHDLYPVGS